MDIPVAAAATPAVAVQVEVIAAEVPAADPGAAEAAEGKSFPSKACEYYLTFKL